jgi:hypothetical protein
VAKTESELQTVVSTRETWPASAQGHHGWREQLQAIIEVWLRKRMIHTWPSAKHGRSSPTRAEAVVIVMLARSPSSLVRCRGILLQVGCVTEENTPPMFPGSSNTVQYLYLVDNVGGDCKMETFRSKAGPGISFSLGSTVMVLYGETGRRVSGRQYSQHELDGISCDAISRCRDEGKCMADRAELPSVGR